MKRRISLLLLAGLCLLGGCTTLDTKTQGAEVRTEERGRISLF